MPMETTDATPANISISELKAKPMAMKGNDITARPASILRSIVTKAILPHLTENEQNLC